ncbi:MAG: NUDIX domain-containing protein [Parachlamydiales bacterium]|jgi:8-oxo-dGTP pyrophosphatase MutT (NUDIX family)
MKKNDESVIGIIFSNDRKKILLIKRRDVPVWVLPGGGIEDNETSTEAVIREILEETGYKTRITKKVGEYTPINKLARYTHLYECQIISGEASLSDETREISFFEVNKLPKLIPPPYPLWISDSLKNEKFLITKKLSSVTYPALLKNLFLHPILVIRFLLTKIGLTINS